MSVVGGSCQRECNEAEGLPEVHGGGTMAARCPVVDGGGARVRAEVERRVWGCAGCQRVQGVVWQGMAAGGVPGGWDAAEWGQGGDRRGQKGPEAGGAGCRCHLP